MDETMRSKTTEQRKQVEEVAVVSGEGTVASVSLEVPAL